MSTLLAMIAAAHGDKRATPQKYDPFRGEPEPAQADITILKDVFVDGRDPTFPDEQLQLIEPPTRQHLGEEFGAARRGVGREERG